MEVEFPSKGWLLVIASSSEFRNAAGCPRLERLRDIPATLNLQARPTGFPADDSQWPNPGRPVPLSAFFDELSL